MKNRRLQNGFSLTEVLMAAGILAVGLLLIAGTFPAGIFLTAAAVEQTIAPIAADEAFAKIQLYGVNWSGLTTTTACADFNEINAIKTATANINGNEYLYPSDNAIEGRVYHWSAICRKVNPDPADRLVQVTVFVSRKMGGGLRYWDQAGNQVDRPAPLKVAIKNAGGGKFEISNAAQFNFINANSTVVFDQSGNIYRVLDREKNIASPDYDTVILDRNWAESSTTGDVWVVPPPTSGGRSPVVGVYQRIIKF